MKEKHHEDVIHLIPEETERRFNRTHFFYLILIFSLALCFVIFGGWYFNRNIFVLRVANECRKDSPTCNQTPDLNKFDCHPENGLTRDRCNDRGCCFKSKSKNFPPLNVPTCYYPSNYEGYVLGNITQDGKLIKADLKRNTSSGFPKDILNLHLVITTIDDSTIRIKITDANADRFEVPIPINAVQKNLETPSYDIKLDSETAQLLISRKSTGSIIFKTDLSQMVYSDQFLQLSNYLPSPYIYGIGEHKDSFLRSVNWTRMTLLNTDIGPSSNYPLYGSHPFYLSLEKDGLANGVFLLNSNPMDVILQPTPAVTFRPIGGIFDFFVMLGPSPESVVQQYTELIGHTFMPPYWSLGFQLCRYGYNSLNKTRETMQRTIDANIPFDVQWNDIDYMERFKDFTYDEKEFAGLPEFVDDIHEKGLHYVIMTDPGISNAEKPGTYPPYDEGLKSDIFIKNPNGSLFIGKVWTDAELVYPDFSHPNSTSWWTKQFADFYNKIKYDGVWIDMNEPSNFYDGEKDGCMTSSFEDPVYVPGNHTALRHKTVCMTAKHYSTIHYNEHNLYAFREATATNHALKTVRQKRPFIISRASYSGQGVQSGHWSGDISSTWEDLRYSVRSMLNFNLYGMSMIGSDICGFNGDTTVPLCARWQALGAFYPFSRNHNNLGQVEQDPVALGPTVVQATKYSLQIRYLLLPYLYTLFHQSHVYGHTVVRPLFFEYPQDENTYSIEEQFLWGPGFMVNPVLYEGVDKVTAYYPKDLWYDNSGKLFNSSGEKVTLQVPITEISVNVRGGHILPGQIPFQTTTASRDSAFLLIAGLDKNKEAKGGLYWDDGDSLDTYANGNYTKIDFSLKNNTLTSTVIRDTYQTVMDFGGIQLAGLEMNPSDVVFNNLQCTRVSFEAELERTFIGVSKLFENRPLSNSTDITCVFAFTVPNLLQVKIEGFDLKTPFNLVWKY